MAGHARLRTVEVSWTLKSTSFAYYKEPCSCVAELLNNRLKKLDDACSHWRALLHGLFDHSPSLLLTTRQHSFRMCSNERKEVIGERLIIRK